MYSIPSYYHHGHELGAGSCSNPVNFLQGVLRSSTTTTTAATNNYMGNSIGGSSTSRSATADDQEEKTAAAKSHSEAERRRRKRINGHLATLRTLLPNTIKTDKASLLAEVVRRLRELKKITTELASASGSDSESSQYSSSLGAANQYTTFPSEADELKLCYCEGDSGTIKATLCCEDRPELVSDMTRAVRSVEGKVVRAEMATVGGRTKSILWVEVSAAGGGGGDGLGRLRRALKVVLDRSSLSTGPGQCLPENKRARFSQY